MDAPRPAARRGLLRRFGLLAAGTLAAAALVPAVLAAPPEGGPPGNNGTVKIHEGPDEPASEVRNQPHVCTFHLHFFFADPVQAGTWEIQEWSPGDKGTVVLSGTYDTAGDGEDRDPDPGVYDLPDGHYKLFWDGDLDTDKHDKHKVFWVDCEEDTAGSPPTGGQSSPPGGDTQGSPPTGNVSESPGGGEAPIGNVNEGEVLDLTPPPTDVEPTTATPASSAGWQAVLLGLATLIAVLAVLPAPTVRTRRPER